MTNFRSLVFCLFTLIFTSCVRRESTPFQIRTLKALDLEETLTRKDKLMLAYTLTSFDAAGKAVGVSIGSWGIVAGVGFQRSDHLDADDILGKSSTELSYQQARLSPVVRVPLTFKNQHLGTGFQYELACDLTTHKMTVRPRR